jgi:hypothetical protein
LARSIHLLKRLDALISVGGERCEADNAYAAEAPQYSKCPACFTSLPEEKGLRQRAQGGHEMINKRIKHFNCLVNPFKYKVAYKIEKNDALFRTCAMVTQVAMKFGVCELYEGGNKYK